MPEETETREILQRLTRIETLLERIEPMTSTATEALSLAREANKRLDKIDKMIFWAGTTVGTAIILAVMALIINNK